MFGDLTVIPGSELEIYDEQCNGPIHLLMLFSKSFRHEGIFLLAVRSFEKYSIELTADICSGPILQKKVKELGGIFIPAHVFTPFKSLYGKGVNQSLNGSI